MEPVDDPRQRRFVDTGLLGEPSLRAPLGLQDALQRGSGLHGSQRTTLASPLASLHGKNYTCAVDTTFPEQVERLREELGITQSRLILADLARRLGEDQRSTAHKRRPNGAARKVSP